MNIAGHIAVAMRLAPDHPRVWLGAALPDLGAMGRFRLMGTSPDPDISAGIAIHHATDDAFHRHPLFTDAMFRLRSDLADAGLERGPARAVAHVGPELLIDGRLLTTLSIGKAVQAAFDEIELVQPALTPLVEQDPDGWDDHLDRIPSWGLPTDYGDPHAVARRLHRILDRRPRLSFDPAMVGPVGERLETEQPVIDAGVPDLLDDLEADLT